MLTITLVDLTADLTDQERRDLNLALRSDLLARDPHSIATTEVNGGDIVMFVNGSDRPQTVAEVIGEIDEFLREP